jgi:Tfp pilus assembly protein PilX
MKIQRSVEFQSGFVLVVALLLLVALSLVGVASLRSVSLQEKMAGNLYFRNLVFQQNEAGMRQAVDRLDSLIGVDVASPVTSDPTDSFWRPFNQEADVTKHWRTKANWTGVFKPNLVGTSSYEVNTLAEDLGSIEEPGCQKNVAKQPGCNLRLVRMTSRTTDSLTGASSIIQQFWATIADN